MRSDTLDLTAKELIELAFHKAGRGARQSQQSDQINLQMHAAKRMKFLVSRSSSVKSRLGAAFGRPEAVVKTVRKGGVRSGKELRRQIAYLINRDEGVLDIRENGVTALDAQEIEDTISEWHDGFTGKSNFGYTRHMIVSFPSDTVPEFAHEAGLEFAERVFGSGDFGDKWDYLSVFHNDTDNPHIHLIVNCRGVENGHWLKTGMTSEMNIDRLRSIQVEVAEEFGIELTATTGLERGLREDVPTETWQVQSGAAVVEDVPETEKLARKVAGQVLAENMSHLADEFGKHSDLSARQIAAVAQQLKEGNALMISDNANTYREADTLARAIETKNGDIAPRAFVQALTERWDVKEGLPPLDEKLKAQINGFVETYKDNADYKPFVSSLADLTNHETFKASDQYMNRTDRMLTGIEASVDAERYRMIDEKTADLVSSIKDMQDIVDQVSDHKLRSQMEIKLGNLKSEVADLRPYDASLQPFLANDDRYKVTLGTDRLDGLKQEGQVQNWQAARTSIMERAEGIGVDGDRLISRFVSQDKVALGTTMQWRDNDVASAVQHRAFAGDVGRARSAVEELHKFAKSAIEKVGTDIKHELKLKAPSQKLEAPQHTHGRRPV